MSRIWKETLSPKYIHQMMGVYNGEYMKQMDRCWNSDDGYQVVSRLIITDWGKVEHAMIIAPKNEEGSYITCEGERDIPWRIKQEIKNEVFGENRVAIEVFPEEQSKVDAADVYHLWVFPKGFSLPFGIHPKRDKQCRVVNRGCPANAIGLAQNARDILG